MTGRKTYVAFPCWPVRVALFCRTKYRVCVRSRFSVLGFFNLIFFPLQKFDRVRSDEWKKPCNAWHDRTFWTRFAMYRISPEPNRTRQIVLKTAFIIVHEKRSRRGRSLLLSTNRRLTTTKPFFSVFGTFKCWFVKLSSIHTFSGVHTRRSFETPLGRIKRKTTYLTFIIYCFIVTLWTRGKNVIVK